MEFHMRGELGERTYRHAGKDQLTERQLEVLAMLSLGFTDPEIAATLYIGETTAKTHVRDILSKLVARNRAHAVHIAHQKGILK